jgi:hypothetical protein
MPDQKRSRSRHRNDPEIDYFTAKAPNKPLFNSFHTLSLFAILPALRP